jgi:hypothetical protein
MSTSYFLLKEVDGETISTTEITENQLNLIALALCDYQDAVYDENSPYYDEKDASDFSQLQGNLNLI